MRLNPTGIPVVLLSHRKQEFLETAIDSLRAHAGSQISEIFVVDDSGDEQHQNWLGEHWDGYSLSSMSGANVGYLSAMRTVWEISRIMADAHNTTSVLLWEEDFVLTRDVDLRKMAAILDEYPVLAQLNLQRQAVYRIERVFGYLESHARRGYHLTKTVEPDGTPWVGRRRPFTTNPGLIRSEVLEIDWPSRRECDRVPGGAEPAMSRCLERMGYRFGWYGEWNTPYTKHIGTEMKTGTGY